MQELLPKLAEPLISIVVVLLGALSAWVAATIKAKVQNDLALGVMQRLQNAVETAVRTVGGTLKASILEAKRDGYLTEEEAARLRKEAVSVVLAYLGDNGAREIERIVGAEQFQKVVFDMIEAQLERLKGSET